MRRTLTTLLDDSDFSESEEEEIKEKCIQQWAPAGRERCWHCGRSAHSAHANVPPADMTESEILHVSSIDMAGYFVLSLYTQATKHADWGWVI